ncbi:hemerythrin domain-containing protein [Sphingosinicella microcystinivorans]|uniref:Hemerythrin HHE cation binding domain-containing protein n=1 Tax=Sphingosinicella microcystinivorans TaxID=335406 RepID=A0AAD1D2S9_SPHMI|nr:hemerythrin domain-containing protein [Sphingosinicella microcystinivorans]RKS88799.1 hemerythrin HHE cation binding domain-containing protein [Sphingosinicella microcystinivorans]BBE32555.1 hypothetical protein SmB9_02130 [Sphingosinicella microcystinivorans]
MDTRTLRKQHDEIGETSETLINAVIARDRLEVARCRWRLARVLIAHLAIEDKWLYPALIRDGAAQVSALAQTFQRDMGGLAAAFNAYMLEWTEDRITNEWEAFQTATWALIEALDLRIRRENEELYPLAEGEMALS